MYAERWRQAPVGHVSSSGLQEVVSAVKAARHEAGADLDQLVGTVVGLAAPVGVQGGRIAEPKLLPGWAEVQLAGQPGGSAIRRELGRKDTGDGIDLLIDDALAGDRAVVDAVTRAARPLGQGLASLAMLLNLQRIVIGGEFSQLAELIIRCTKN